MARIRRANVWLAVLVIVVSALWLTPVLDPYRISAASQVSRYLRGQSSLDELPLWELAHDWGRPGLRALDRLEEMPAATGGEALARRIAAARSSTSTWRYGQAVVAWDRPERAARLREVLAVRPEGVELPGGVLEKADDHLLDQLENGCGKALPDGRPGCVLVVGRFLPGLPEEDQAILLTLGHDDSVSAWYLVTEEGALGQRSMVTDARQDDWPELKAADLARVLDGDFSIRPSGGNALWLGSKALVPAR